MGASNWSTAKYSSRMDDRKKRGSSGFDYSTTVKASGNIETHEKMDPHGVDVRESRDSDVHPEAVPIGVIFDETGSMGSIPEVFVTKLGALMRVLVENGYVDHPAVLFGGVGDATCDRAPLQIGQFESGLEMDDDLTRIVLEGGGGGQKTESYELAMYFFARHTATDHLEKRGKRGYLFTLGDELPYDRVKRQEVERVIGDNLQADIPTEEIVEELREKWNYFHIFVAEGSYREEQILPTWKDLLGEHVLVLEDKDAVAETIALQIGMCEGTIHNLDDAANDLANAGFDSEAIVKASGAVVKTSGDGAPALATVEGTLPEPTTDDGGRL